MDARSSFRSALVALCLVLGACGGKPSPKQGHGRTPLPGPDTASSVVQRPATPPAVKSAKTPTARARSMPGLDTLPDVIRKTFPSAGSVRSVSKPFPHRVIADSSGQVLGYEVFSDSAGVTGKGYAGVVPVQVFLNGQAKPVRIYVLDNSETPGYLAIALSGGLLERLLAYDPAKPDSVDAVTLATCSSKAIIAGVTGLAARVSNEILVRPGQGSR